MKGKKKKFTRFYKRTYFKYPKKYKKLKKSKCYFKRIFKIIFIFIMIFINYIFFLISNYMKKTQLNNKNNNNNWIKKNMTEFINNYFSIFKNKNDSGVLTQYNYLKEYLSLKVMIKGNSTLNLQTKEKLIKKLSEKTKKNFSLIKNVFMTDGLNFGNLIVSFNNLIYYCEILGIKNIFLNSKINWFIKNDINTDKIHISFISRDSINCYSYDTYCGWILVFYFPIVVKSERRSIILKDEIKRNLPSILVNKNDLYIYIRSGDSFNIHGNGYPQAPYCFYQKIISEFKFNDIYLISQDDKSPVIQKLLKDHPKIKHNLNSKEIDIAILMNAYNLVNAVSSFSLASISFNDNLMNLFVYEQYKLGSAIVHFHYDIDKLDKKFNIYRMKPSEEYFVREFNWENTIEQRKLLFEEKCKYDLRKTKYIKTIFD